MTTNINYEQFVNLFSEVLESTKNICDVVSRTDERVKIIRERQEDIDKKISNLDRDYHIIINRLVLLESKNFDKLELRIRNIEDSFQTSNIKVESLSSNWKNITDNIIKGIFGVAIAWIIWKLGIH